MTNSIQGDLFAGTAPTLPDGFRYEPDIEADWRVR